MFGQVRPLLPWLASPCLPQQTLAMGKEVLICVRLLNLGELSGVVVPPSLPGSGALLLMDPHVAP